MQPFILSSLMVPPDVKLGFPGIAVVKKQGESCKRGGFNPWIRMIPWCRKWQPAPVFLPGKFHGQRSLAGYSPWGRKEWDATEQREGSSVQFSSVQLLSHVPLFATPWIAACQASLSITNTQSSPKLMCIELVMPSSHLILCCPLLLLPSIPPSIRVFSNESTLRMRWPKYWNFSLRVVKLGQSHLSWRFHHGIRKKKNGNNGADPDNYNNIWWALIQL